MKSGASDPFGEDESAGENESDRENESAGEDGSASGEESAGGEERAVEDGSATEDESGESRQGTRSGDEVTEGGANAGDVESQDRGEAVEATGPVEEESGEDGVASIDRSQIPWLLRRENVKDDRPHVHQLFVRDDTDGRARRAESRLEERLDTDVYRLDAREAIYLVGMEHLDEVAALLEEWGYNF